MSKTSKGSGLTSFIRRHPIFSNIIAIVVSGIVLIWLLGVVFLGFWTRHGQTVAVPPLKGLNVNVATEALIKGGFEVELDSIYDNAVTPGTVLEQSPHQGAIVKEGRTIYLMYACFTPKLIKVPQYYNMSRRQAIASFEEVGLTNLTVKEVPSEHADLVIAAKYNGLHLRPGTEIPSSAPVTIEVGAGMPGNDGFSDDSYEELVLPEDEDEEFINSLDI